MSKKAKVKDHSHTGLGLPDVPPLDLCLYHWSPTSNRKKIKKNGLVPGSHSIMKEWKPPYVCFSDDPNLAWHLSGRMYPNINSWDLWMVQHEVQTSYEGYEIILDTYVDTGRHFIKEYRIYHRIFKRDVEYVGTRVHS